MNSTTAWWIRKIIAGVAFGCGAFLTSRHNPALLGVALMLSVSIIAGAWIIGFNLNKK